MNLTDKQVQHLVKPGRYNAGITGLHLRVVSKEKKYWVLRYSLDFPQYRRHFSMSDLLLFKLNGA